MLWKLWNFKNLKFRLPQGFSGYIQIFIVIQCIRKQFLLGMISMTSHLFGDLRPWGRYRKLKQISFFSHWLWNKQWNNNTHKWCLVPATVKTVTTWNQSTIIHPFQWDPHSITTQHAMVPVRDRDNTQIIFVMEDITVYPVYQSLYDQYINHKAGPSPIGSPMQLLWRSVWKSGIPI